MSNAGSSAAATARAAVENLPRISTGSGAYDDALGTSSHDGVRTQGGMPGNLNIVAGEPGIGKTTLLALAAITATKHGTVVCVLPQHLDWLDWHRELVRAAGAPLTEDQAARIVVSTAPTILDLDRMIASTSAVVVTIEGFPLSDVAEALHSATLADLARKHGCVVHQSVNTTRDRDLDPPVDQHSVVGIPNAYVTTMTLSANGARKLWIFDVTPTDQLDRAIRRGAHAPMSLTQRYPVDAVLVSPEERGRASTIAMVLSGRGDAFSSDEILCVSIGLGLTVLERDCTIRRPSPATNAGVLTPTEP